MRQDEIDRSLLAERRMAETARPVRSGPQGFGTVGSDHIQLPIGSSTEDYEKIGRRFHRIEVTITPGEEEIDVFVRSTDGTSTVRYWNAFGRDQRRNRLTRAVVDKFWDKIYSLQKRRK